MKKRKTIFTFEKVNKKWYKVDATDKVLGRLASKIAIYLMGKHKPVFSRQVDNGDYIVVVNASKVKVTGAKEKNKTYFTHSGYPGGDKTTTFEKLLAVHPDRVIRLAVRGMIPHNRLGDKLINKLKIYKGEAKEYDKLQVLEV
ncbi:MAG: 50S ribosomal protein L13 [Candidatus Margulisiibacteriota bacterium]